MKEEMTILSYGDYDIEVASTDLSTLREAYRLLRDANDNSPEMAEDQ